MKIESPYVIKSIKFQRNYPGYLYRREIIDDTEYGGDGDLEMVNCYSSDNGYWIGDSQLARYLCKEIGLRRVQKSYINNSACSIGFNEDEQKWYGWSHRCLCGFGIGDKLFEENFGDDQTLFTQHGKEDIVTLDEARKAAMHFSTYVS